MEAKKKLKTWVKFKKAKEINEEGEQTGEEINMTESKEKASDENLKQTR